MKKAFLLLALVSAIIGCTTVGIASLNQRFGQPTPKEAGTGPDSLNYQRSIRPLLEKRCTVCHGCYDAPCQLKLDAYQGLLRGANKDKVYNGTRLFGAALTRLFEDAHSTAGWRKKDFYPVLNERGNTPEANLTAGVMARMLNLKAHHPLPNQPVLPASFDFSINRDQQCPKIEEFASFANNYPLWGMPYGLPGLNKNEQQRLLNWLKKGAHGGPLPAIDPALLKHINRWETLFNRDSKKAQLVNRYLYEHLFLASLYFPGARDTVFRLVRSRTPPGQPIERISTRRPFDAPGVKRVYYRLWRDPSTRLAKTFLPYALSKARWQQWQDWFFAANFTVKQLPSYKPEQASNPFVTFKALPVLSRYRFLLSQAQFTIMNFIKGPVCRGQVALNVIQDHFWVFFLAPNALRAENNSAFLARNSEHLRLPAEDGNLFRPLSRWLKYAKWQNQYLEAKARFVSREVQHKKDSLSLDVIWDGDKTNPNAALTVFRHNDSASVEQGLVGQPPKTAWVLTYPLMERIHYLLVAGFDVYGNVSHQLLSRLYMDFLRIEGEMNFVSLLPKPIQKREIQLWYRGAEDDIDDYLSHYLDRLPPIHAVDYSGDTDPKLQLYNKLRQRLTPSMAHSRAYQQHQWPKPLADALGQLQNIAGPPATLMPEVSVVLIPHYGVFTIMRNSAYSNLSSLFNEDGRRLPAEDTLTVTAGIIGAYPNSFLLVNSDKLTQLVATISGMQTEKDYTQLKNRFGIRRSDPNFWAYSDMIMAAYRREQPASAGLLDYNRLENR